jgi:VWFA-related protein
MRMMVHRLLALSLIPSLVLSASGQISSQRSEQKIRISTAEVVLDVLVKDKKGNPVTDLSSSDFEVLEDGVKQSLASFKLISRSANGIAGTSDAETSGKATSAPSELTRVEKRPDPDVGVNVVALVFDRLSGDARKRAADAAASFLSGSSASNTFVGVFSVNLSLKVIQNYTTNTALVKKGIEHVETLASSSFDSSSLKSGTTPQETLPGRPINTTTPPAGGTGPEAALAAAAGVDQQFESMRARTEETFEVLQRDQQGYATTNGLLAVVNSMRRLPGRKALIFFSEGMAIPPNVQQHFRSVINAANRANVSLYPVDSAGLRAESPVQETRDEINARARQRIENLHIQMRSSDALTKGLERNEDLLNLNPQNALIQLATETGGTFIGDTNNLEGKLKQVDQELNTFYLMTYAPINQHYDGKFRNISVKVKRSGVEIVSRKGYYSVPPTGDSPLFYFEALPLGVLNQPKSPKDFPILVNSLNFPDAAKPGRTIVEVEAPAAVFTFSSDSSKKVYTTDFSFVVLIKDKSQQVIDKLSHHYSLIGPLASIDSTKKGKVLFYRETNLPPGKYDLEAVVFDALSNKASVNKSAIEIMAGAENSLRLSSVAIIQRAEKIQEKTDSPFQIGEVLIYPNLGEPIRKSVNQQMGFYFNVYPAKGLSDLPQLTLELLQTDKSIAKIPLKLAAPDKDGRIQYASALPLGSLSPGSYQLKITVSDAKDTVSRSTAFILEQ